MGRMKLLTLLLLAAALAGCDSKPSAGPAAGGKTTIAVIPKGETHVFWQSVHAGAAKAAKEFDVEIIWKGPLQENDRAGQIAEVETFINRGVTGICLAPLDDAALRKPVAAAMAKKIPVVIFDSGLRSEDYVSFVATDNLKGGQIAGEHLGKILGGKGKVALLRYMQGSASTAEREQGFVEAIKKYPGIELVSDNQYAGATIDTAQKVSENLLASLKTAEGKLSIDGLFCPNESSSIGMLLVLRNLKLAGTVKFIGFDSSDKIISALKAKEMHGTIVQNPVKMGYLAVKSMVEHLKGQKVERRIDTGAALVTPETMDQPEMNALLNPERLK